VASQSSTYDKKSYHTLHSSRCLPLSLSQLHGSAHMSSSFPIWYVIAQPDFKSNTTAPKPFQVRYFLSNYIGLNPTIHFILRFNGWRHTQSTKLIVDPIVDQTPFDLTTIRYFGWTNSIESTHPKKRFSLSTLVLRVTRLVELGDSLLLPLTIISPSDNLLSLINPPFFLVNVRTCSRLMTAYLQPLTVATDPPDSSSTSSSG